MVFTVRCYKCGEEAVRLVLGGRAILHARCQACDANLLAEVLEFEDQVKRKSSGAGEDTETGEDGLPDTAEVDRDPPTTDLTELD